MNDVITRIRVASVVLGAVAFGKPKPTTRDHPLSSDHSCDELLRAFTRSGGKELDTSRVYQNGNCEAIIGRVPAGQSIRIGTKYHPGLPGGPLVQMQQTLTALKRDSVSIYYIHMPSTEIMLEDTLAEMNQCHEAGQIRGIWIIEFSGLAGG